MTRKTNRGGPGRGQGPKNLSGSRGASPVLRVRVTPELLADAERKAESAGLSLADWVRMVISQS